jgi:hypothetical protein
MLDQSALRRDCSSASLQIFLPNRSGPDSIPRISHMQAGIFSKIDEENLPCHKCSRQPSRKLIRRI